MDSTAGEDDRGALRVGFDRRLKLEFHASGGPILDFIRGMSARINLSNDGIQHTLSRHLNPARAGNKSQFTLPESELRSLLGAKSTVQATAQPLETGNFARTITTNRTVGNLAEKMGGGSTNTFTVITDKFGNLQTAFPGGL